MFGPNPSKLPLWKKPGCKDMAQRATRPFESEPSSGRPIDHAHLARMTFGDAKLARELLRLFDRQAELLMARIRAGDDVLAAAHTLKGSALGVGAMAAAAAAEAVERAGATAREAAIERLSGVIKEAHAAIAALAAGERPISAKG